MKKLLFTILLCLIMATSVYGQFWENPNQKPGHGLQVNWPNKGLVGCWLFNEGSGGQVSDLSGNGYTITLNGATWTAGKFGNALEFNGSNAYGNTGNFDLSTTDKVTVSFWIKVHTFPAASNWEMIIELSDNIGNYTDSFFVSLYDDDGTIDVSLNGDVGWSIWRTTTKLTANVWSHVVATFDKSLSAEEAKVFLNGLLDGANISEANNTNNFGNRPLYFGARAGSSLWADVEIDNVCIFNRILSNSEIAKFYQKPFCMIQPSWNWVLYGGISVPAGAGQFIFINQ